MPYIRLSMSPLPKRLLIIAVALGLLLVLVLAAALAYVNTGAFRRQMIGRIDAAIAGRIEWSHHRIAPFAGDLILGDIRLLDTNGDTLATIQRLSLSLRWRSLARRTLHITQLRIDAPVVFAVLDADNQLNLLAALSPTAPPPSEPPSDTSPPSIPFGIRLDDLQLHQGRVTFDRPAEALSGEAADIAITGRGDLAHPSARVALTLGQVRLQTPDGAHRLHDVTLTAEYDARAADPIALALQTPRSRLAITGRVDTDPTPLTLALVGDLDLDLAEIQAWLPESIDLSGRVTGRITANGAPADPDATVTLAWNDGGVLGLDLQQLDLTLQLAQRQVQLQQLAVRAPWGEVDLTGGADLRPMFPASFTHQAAGIETLTYDLTLAVRQFTPGRLGAIDLPLNGTWQARAHMAGSGLPGPDGGTGEGEVDLQVADLVLVDAGIPTSATLTLAARWDAQHLTLVRSEGNVGNQRIVADGRIAWNSFQLTAAGHFHSPRLEELGALLGVALPTGSAALEFRGQGDARQPEVHAVLVARELAWQTWTIGQLLVEADLDRDGVVQLPRLVLENQGSFIEGRGEVALLAPGGGLRDDPTLSVTLDFDPLQAAHFAADLPAALRLHGRLAVNGPLDDPRAQLTVAPSTLQWGAVAARVTGALGWQAGGLTVSDLHLSTDRSAVRLDGKAQWQDPHSGQWTDDPQLSARLTADPLHLEDFLDGYQGAVTVQADLAGTLSQLRGTFGLDSGALDLGVQKVAAVHLAGRLTPGKAHADTLTVTLAPGQQIQASGWYGFDQHFEAQVDLQGLDLRHIDALGPDAPLKGALELTLTAAGTVADPEASGHLRIREPRLDNRLFDDFEARFRLQQQQLTVDADLTFTLTANAR
ncbi:MAG: AsmA family protein, partial [Desulfatitalea sp.]|nr:AsmA family protein [Desulfatitalea sp.]